MGRVARLFCHVGRGAGLGRARLAMLGRRMDRRCGSDQHRVPLTSLPLGRGAERENGAAHFVGPTTTRLFFAQQLQGPSPLANGADK